MAENDVSLSLLPTDWRPCFVRVKRRTAEHRTSTKSIVFLGGPGTQILDITGPFQVFVRAAEIYLRSYPKRNAPYKVLLASTTSSRTILTNCGLSLTATDTVRSLPAQIHTLFVAGGTEVEQETHDKDLIAWLRKASPRVQRLGSICTGAFLLASAGLLDGKRAATHWKWASWKRIWAHRLRSRWRGSS